MIFVRLFIGESYAQAMMILEQGLSNLKGGDDTEDAMGMFMLAMSTLSYERLIPPARPPLFSLWVFLKW